MIYLAKIASKTIEIYYEEKQTLPDLTIHVQNIEQVLAQDPCKFCNGRELSNKTKPHIPLIAYRISGLESHDQILITDASEPEMREIINTFTNADIHLLLSIMHSNDYMAIIGTRSTTAFDL